MIDDHPDVVVGSDITANGRPNLVVGVGSSEACRHGVVVLELGHELRMLDDDYAAAQEGHGGARHRWWARRLARQAAVNPVACLRQT